jgi:UDP-2-acetamido-3-amino-2,3-dideoxy-glucuronate N-acetyltransferase
MNHAHTDNDRFQFEIIHLTEVRDDRGCLSVSEFPTSLPFVITRYFIVSDVPLGATRGDHAHRTCHQFLIAVQGSIDITFVAGDGELSSFALRDSSVGVHIPPLVWSRQTYLSHDAILLVGASEAYSKSEYVSDFDEYRTLTTRGPTL